MFILTLTPGWYLHQVGDDLEGAAASRGELAAVDVGDLAEQALDVSAVATLHGDLGHICRVTQGNTESTGVTSGQMKLKGTLGGS